GGAIKEFRQLLAVETSADVQTINPFEQIHVSEDYFEPAFIERIAPQASICMGLAIRRVSDK
ncbi:MAG: pilus assembly protein PilM, partial [Deltaproteobacteria bacterium]|nr:pilus assembly protein PilM [Deltaproteobacteria bacterium]